MMKNMHFCLTLSKWKFSDQCSGSKDSDFFVLIQASVIGNIFRVEKSHISFRSIIFNQPLLNVTDNKEMNSVSLFQTSLGQPLHIHPSLPYCVLSPVGRDHSTNFLGRSSSGKVCSLYNDFGHIQENAIIF